MKGSGWLVLVLAGCFSFAQEHKKVVVLGFDGADHAIVESMLEQGELPHLKKLQESGGYAPLLPTNPPQTPVSWSTFATGLNPGRTGIFDFIKRQAGTYTPDFALRGETTRTLGLGQNNRLVFPIVVFLLLGSLLLFLARKRKPLFRWLLALAMAGPAAYGTFYIFSYWVPSSVPAAFTVRQGKPMWELLQEKGKTATIIRLPVTFPAEPLDGQMVSGLAVPDIRGTVGKPSIYTNDPQWLPSDNQFSIEIKRLEGPGPYETEILGPPNKFLRDGPAKGRYPKDFHLPMKIQVQGDQLHLNILNQSYTVGKKTWTPWIEFTYKINPLVRLTGSGRFYLDQLQDNRFKLYLTPIHLHPASPLPLTYPQSLAKQIWDIEPYKTMGWALDTWSIGNDLMDEEHFLEDVDLTVTRFEKMMEAFLKDNDRDLFVQVFSFTDRVGHIFWRYWDEGHPLYDPEKGPRYQEALRGVYRRMDTIVGKALEQINLDETVFLVCSDHGFSSWRHQFNFNTWLVKNGYMKLEKNVLGEAMELDDLENKMTPLTYVDWSETKAYAMGLGMIFINLEGREPEGSVTAEEYDAVCAQLAADLEAFVDEKTGLHPVKKVYQRDQIYRGYDKDVTPDLRVATAVNYRVSWDTTLGGMPLELTEPNLRNWSGDHCSLDPEDVRGILFSSVPIKSERPTMADMCPSILEILGVTHDIDMDGTTIFGN